MGILLSTFILKAYMYHDDYFMYYVQSRYVLSFKSFSGLLVLNKNKLKH